MRTALIHNAPSGGAKRAIYEWARRLAQRHSIDVYTLSTADHAFCDIRSFVQHHHTFDFTPRKLFKSPWGRFNQLIRWRDLGELLRVGKHIAAEIDRRNYDVLFAHTCRYTVIPAILQFLRTPTVYYLHEPFGHTFERRIDRPYRRTNRWRENANRFDPLIGLYRRRLETIQSRSLHGPVKLLANSRFTEGHMKREHNLQMSVCHCGVDCEGFRPDTNIQKEEFVLSVGELTPRKGFDFVIESLGRISPGLRPKLKLISNMVIPDERQYIEGLALRHQVDLEISIGLNTAELAVQYNKAAICVYAPVMEPFGLVPLEAMACSTPVVGVRDGGVSESVVHEQTGLLVDRNPELFAAAVRTLLLNRKLSTEYGLNGRARVVQEWTWDQSVADVERHLLAGARGSG